MEAGDHEQPLFNYKIDAFSYFCHVRKVLNPFFFYGIVAESRIPNFSKSDCKQAVSEKRGNVCAHRGTSML